MAPRSRCRSAGPEDEGKRQDDRGEEERRIAEPAATPPRAARHRVQPDEQVGRREEVEVEGGEQGGQDPGEAHPGGVPAERDAHEQQDGEEAGETEGRGPVREEPGPQDGRDLELRAARLPGVVVGVSLDELPWRAEPGLHVEDEPDPAHAARREDEQRGDRGRAPAAGQAAGQAPTRRARGPRP